MGKVFSYLFVVCLETNRIMAGGPDTYNLGCLKNSRGSTFAQKKDFAKKRRVDYVVPVSVSNKFDI